MRWVAIWDQLLIHKFHFTCGHLQAVEWWSAQSYSMLYGTCLNSSSSVMCRVRALCRCYRFSKEFRNTWRTVSEIKHSASSRFWHMYVAALSKHWLMFELLELSLVINVQSVHQFSLHNWMLLLLFSIFVWRDNYSGVIHEMFPKVNLFGIVGVGRDAVYMSFMLANQQHPSTEWL